VRKIENMENSIERLIMLTTIIKPDDNLNRESIFGEEYISRFQEDQSEQVNLIDLEVFWNNKWKSFSNSWNKERQDYRFLYDSFKLFYFSFEQLRFNKVACIEEALGDEFKMLHFNELTGVSLYGMYHHGKKCVDLLKKLDLIDINCQDGIFCKKFSETRNKLIEHNFNPNNLNLQIEPSIWSLSSTNSLMQISIHTETEERAYDVYIDYYNDYFKLEKVIVDIVKKF